MAVPANRVVIGLDYGTTFTGVAFQGVGQAGNSQFSLVTDWPDNRIREKVPSDISYSPTSHGESQWGGHFSNGSRKLEWTKLELDQQKRSEELKLILNALIGTNNLDFEKIQQSDGLPSYPAKDPVEIVANYLEKVRIYLWRDLLSTFGQVLLDEIPIDLVVTVPAIWSEPAKNRTFRAICKAGFDNAHFKGLREVIMITEPEATAVSIMKTLSPQFGDQGILPGDSIVVCDAGGGTVDLVSYQVRQVTPTIEVGEVTLGTGDKCGATFIDRRFKQWLEKKLGQDNFQELAEESDPFDSIGSHTIVNPAMAKIMEKFEEIKKRFTGIGGVGNEFITLPHPLNNLTDPENGIADGEIRITEHDLRDLFYPSVKRVIELIKGQIASVELEESRVKYVFLSGGFAASEHLYHEVDEVLRLRGIKIHRPETAWSQVVRGAVAWGVDADANRMVYMRKCRRHYGVSVSEPFSSFKHSEADAYIDGFDGEEKAKEQMIWLIKKGDAILSNEPKRASINIRRKFGRNDPRIFKTLLVSSDENKAHQRFADVPIDTRTVTPVSYDFSNIPDDQLRSIRVVGGRSPYFLVNFEIKIQLQTNLDIRVTCNGNQMGRLTINYD